MRRLPNDHAAPANGGSVLTSPCDDAPVLSAQVCAWGAFEDEHGEHALSVTVSRVLPPHENVSDGVRIIVRDSANQRDQVVTGGHSDARETAVSFRTEAGVRAFATLLVAAAAEAERRGILGRAPTLAGGGLR